MIQQLEIISGGERLLLNNYRSIFWPVRKMLILADLHAGKPAHFRRHGIALPQQIIQRDLDRLTVLIEYYMPTQIVVAGDLLHAGTNSETEWFGQWLEKMPDIKWTIVKGNHDKMLGTFHGFKNLEINDHLYLHPFHFVHEPQVRQYVSVSGHIHPGVKLKGIGRQTLKLPCFLVSPQQIILPAFSLFTGLDTDFVKHHPEFTSVYVVSDEGIFETKNEK
jgi:DNA ligase-associated metallophosphoesterase